MIENLTTLWTPTSVHQIIGILTRTIYNSNCLTSTDEGWVPVVVYTRRWKSSFRLVLIGPILNSYLKTCNFTEINRDCQTYAIRRDHAHPFLKTYSENLLSSKNHGALLKRVFLRKFRKLFLRIDIAKLESLETHLRLKVCRNIVYWWDVCVSILDQAR